MVYRGHVKDGVVVLDQATDLPEGAEVRVAVATQDASESTLGARLMKFAGKLDGLPSDLARNHDHYLHGLPKEVKEVFADTAYYLALLNVRDELHDRAVVVTSGISDRLLTTTWVLTEVADGLCRPPFRQTVVEFINVLRLDPEVTIVPASQELFDRGFDLLMRRPDKEWSLTDCISCVVMWERGVTDSLTSDHHFEQMGFRTLL